MTVDQLNAECQLILSEMSIIKEKHKSELAPFDKKIDALNEKFMDEKLVDKNGDTISVGMTIKINNIEYKVIRRFQQCLFQFLGNCRVVCTTENKKKPIELWAHHLTESEIVNYTLKGE